LVTFANTPIKGGKHTKQVFCPFFYTYNRHFINRKPDFFSTVKGAKNRPIDKKAIPIYDILGSGLHIHHKSKKKYNLKTQTPNYFLRAFFEICNYIFILCFF